jgi:hypothetical protein
MICLGIAARSKVKSLARQIMWLAELPPERPAFSDGMELFANDSGMPDLRSTWAPTSPGRFWRLCGNGIAPATPKAIPEKSTVNLAFQPLEQRFTGQRVFWRLPFWAKSLRFEKVRKDGAAWSLV